jgi:hypothetical protein
MIRLETVLDSWKTVRQDTAQGWKIFPAGEIAFKPLSDVTTFGEIARHILVAGYGITGMLLDGVENLATPQFRKDMQKYAAELALTPDAGAVWLPRCARAWSAGRLNSRRSLRRFSTT